MNHSGKWTDTEFDYTSSNINRIYMYLHRECHFLLTLTCAVICGVLLVCVFALLALMWFYLFDCLFNVTSSPSVCTRSPQSPHILTTQETGKHSGKTPKLSLALVVSFVFSLHLPRSLSYDILQSVAMKRQEVRVTVVCSLLTRCLEVSSYSHCCLTFAWNAKNNTVQVWKLANNREKRTQKHPKKDISVLLSPFFLCLIFRGRLRERIVSDSNLPQDIQKKSEMTCSTEMSFLSFSRASSGWMSLKPRGVTELRVAEGFLYPSCSFR